MRKLKKIAAVLSATMMLFAAGCGKVDPAEKPTRAGRSNLPNATTEEAVNKEAEEAFKQFEDDYFKYVMGESFLNYHYSIKDGSKFGIDRPKASWGEADWSEEGVEKDQKEAREWYDKLTAIDREGLNSVDQVSYDVYKEEMELDSDQVEYRFYTGDFSPMRGIQSDFASYFTDYPFYEKQDVEDYVLLLEQSGDYIQELLKFEAYRADLGFAMSDANIDDVVEQCQTFVKDGDKHFLITLFDKEVDKLDFLTDDEKAQYKERNKKAIIEVVIPAFNNIEKTLPTLKGKSKNQGGLAGYDKGKECYALIMKSRTGSSKSPDEALELLYARLDELMMEMAEAYKEDPDGYQYYISNYDNLLSEADNMKSKEVIDKLMDVAMKDYPELPTIPYNVDYLDETLETIMENTLAYYRSPALDTPDNNIIRVNGGHKDGQWATLAHEGCPGHMFQNAYYMSTNPSNLRAVNGFVGYMEGWAKYVEYQVYDVYDYPNTESDATVAKLSRIESELGMLIMGIFDIEVNYNNWSVEDAKKFMSSHGYAESAAESIINTVAGDPAAYQSYVLGYYEMKSLRDKAEEELGSKFDPVEFNRVILETGPCQFDILGKQVDKYIEKNK